MGLRLRGAHDEAGIGLDGTADDAAAVGQGDEAVGFERPQVADDAGTQRLRQAREQLADRQAVARQDGQDAMQALAQLHAILARDAPIPTARRGETRHQSVTTTLRTPRASARRARHPLLQVGEIGAAVVENAPQVHHAFNQAPTQRRRAGLDLHGRRRLSLQQRIEPRPLARGRTCRSRSSCAANRCRLPRTREDLRKHAAMLVEGSVRFLGQPSTRDALVIEAIRHRPPHVCVLRIDQRDAVFRRIARDGRGAGQQKRADAASGPVVRMIADEVIRRGAFFRRLGRKLRERHELTRNPLAREVLHRRAHELDARAFVHQIENALAARLHAERHADAARLGHLPRALGREDLLHAQLRRPAEA